MCRLELVGVNLALRGSQEYASTSSKQEIRYVTGSSITYPAFVGSKSVWGRSAHPRGGLESLLSLSGVLPAFGEDMFPY